MQSNVTIATMKSRTPSTLFVIHKSRSFGNERSMERRIRYTIHNQSKRITPQSGTKKTCKYCVNSFGERLNEFNMLREYALGARCSVSVPCKIMFTW